MQATGELVAGRELDALVAEKVMGDSPPPLAEWRRDWLAQVPAYSTEIAAAWQVVEHFNRRGRDAFFELNHAPHIYGAAFDQDLLPDIGGTAPLAICRAALTAISRP